MTSRVGARAAGFAAVAAILLLVVLIVLLWTGVGQGLFHAKSSVPHPPPPAKSLSLENDTRPEEIRKPGREAPPSSDLADNVVYREVVRPIKVSSRLHEDDIRYGADQVRASTEYVGHVRHHSGHFRHKAANIWDPHPSYEFTAFNRQFHLLLEHDSKYTSPNLQVTHVWHNTSARETPSIKPNGCFYKGHVRGDPKSSIRVNLCHGMTGHIKTGSGSYFIQPAEQSESHANPMEHYIYDESKKDRTTVCGLDDLEPSKLYRRDESDELDSKTHFDYETDYGHRGRMDSDELDASHSRRKRSTWEEDSQGFFVELLVVADRSMVKYHGKDFVVEYILSLIYIVSGIFKDASIGNPISIALVNMKVLHAQDFVRHRYSHSGVSAGDMLREFCRFQERENPLDDSDPYHHDTALLLTRENLCRNASAQKCDTLGLAELGTMCSRTSSCSLVQDNGLSAAFTIAHELGHVLNMPHDKEPKCQQLFKSDSVCHVMSTSIKEGTDPWSWSPCSRHVLTEFLDSRRSDCLRDLPQQDHINDLPVDTWPGENITGNRQCELLYGAGSVICPFMPVCSALWCSKVNSDGCQTLHMPWGDGTPCGANAWCQRGLCVRKDRSALKRVDGGWGEWQEFGPCTRTCGGGIRKAFRECDNPRPKHGGRYCVGSRSMVESCSTEECPEGARDFREVQCAKFDHVNHNIHGLPQPVRWVPKYGLREEDLCKLYCRVSYSDLYYMLNDRVIDGTPCSRESFDICVNGRCEPAGCDHRLNSHVEMDICGQCGGRNDTCQLIRGLFNVTAIKRGYRPVVKIPAGSSNLDIRQYGINATDNNYLALTDPVTHGSLLNNGNILTTFRKFINYEGVTLEYSGCLTAVERVNATRPLKRDLLVEVFAAGELTPPTIMYEYTIPNVMSDSSRYAWNFAGEDSWEPCDLLCHGQQWRKVFCWDVLTKTRVEDELCSARSRPSPPSRRCNTHCQLQWRITGRTDCSAHCGRGQRNVTSQCIQELTEQRQWQFLRDSDCVHLVKPSVMEECENACDPPKWKMKEWSQCSQPCGKGVQQRQVLCVSSLGTYVHDSKCAYYMAKPQDQKACFTPCYKWQLSRWSSCSEYCGKGQRRRDVLCLNVTVENNAIYRYGQRHQLVEESLCKKYEGRRPKAVSDCYRKLCPNSWVESEWSECSAECGVGTRTRNVSCHIVNAYGWLDPTPTRPEYCNSKRKPEMTQTCLIRDCSEDLFWEPEPWQACTQKCGRKGTQRRNFTCRHKDGRVLMRKNCQDLRKPRPKSQKCNMFTLCGLKSCKEVQVETNARVDAEYPMLVGGRNMSVYCKDMNTARPSEYLTLPRSEDNYSEYYDKRLIYPNTCPANGTRHDNCRCHSHPVSSSGFTKFDKVGLDVQTLEIHTHDFTYTRQVRGRPIGLGEAGDCYSKKKCAQGQFKVNLEGTWLAISRAQKWTKKLHLTHMEIRLEDQQRVQGRCGGFCGLCGPEPSGRLKLQVIPPS